MRNALTVAATVAVLSLAAAAAAIAQAAPPEQISALDAQLQADAATIKADKAQIDRDEQAGNEVAVTQDRHRLFEATEQQEYDRGTSENDGTNDAKKGW